MMSWPIRWIVLSTAMVVFATACSDGSSPADNWNIDEEESCGDHRAADWEACDGTDLRGRTCQDFGFPDGELSCNQSCTGYLVEQCSGVPDWSYERVPSCLDCAEGQICVDGECAEPCSGAPALDDPLEFDMRMSRVSGTVTEDGEPLGADHERPSLRFVNRHIPNLYAGGRPVPVEADGTFRVGIFDGLYDVYISGVRGPIASDLPVNGDGTLDIELPDLIDLDITLVPPDLAPAEELSGELVVERFVDDDSGTDVRTVYANEFERGDPPRASMRVRPGRFRISFRSDPIGDSSYTEFTLVDSRHIAQDTQLDVPIELHTLSIGVERDPEIEEGSEHARVKLTGIEPERSSTWDSLDEDGRFTTTVAEGRYEVSVYFDRLSPLPGRESAQTRVVEVDSDRHVELPLGSGLVSVGGRLQTDTADTEFELLFSHKEDPAIRRMTPLTDGHFLTTLPPGRYETYAYPVDAPANGLERARLADIDARESTDEVVLSMTEFTEPVRLETRVTVNGETMPENTLSDDSRGWLYFRCVAPRHCSSRYYSDVGPRGEAGFEAGLLPGTYEVHFESPGRSSDGTPNQSNAVPPGHYILDPHFELNADMTRREFDLKVVQLSGEVTASGAEFPPAAAFASDGAGHRGPIIADAAVRRVSNSPRVELDEDGPARFDLDVFPGFYTLKLRLAGFARFSAPPPAGLKRTITLADDTELTWDLPLRRGEVHLRRRGEEWSGSDRDAAFVHTSTAWGASKAPVGLDGTADIWWLGEDPTLVFHDEESRSRPFMLREGCR